MRIIRALAVSAIVTAGTILAATAPASAKGPESVTLAGPGIDGSIVIGGWGAADQDASTDYPAYLHHALRQFTDFFLWEVDAAVSEEPPAGEDLGPKYTLTWTMSGPSGADPEDYTIVQELYPETSSQGSYIRTLANGYTDRADMWVPVDPVLGDMLDAYSAAPADEAVAAAARTSTPASTDTDQPSSGIHPVATLAAATSTFAVGLTFGRRRRWPWPWAAKASGARTPEPLA
jgi:hypothetical protein